MEAITPAGAEAQTEEGRKGKRKRTGGLKRKVTNVSLGLDKGEKRGR